MSYIPDFFAHLFLDPYNRKARLQPILLSFLPVLVASLLLVPGLHTVWRAHWWASFILWNVNATNAI